MRQIADSHPRDELLVEHPLLVDDGRPILDEHRRLTTTRNLLQVVPVKITQVGRIEAKALNIVFALFSRKDQPNLDEIRASPIANDEEVTRRRRWVKSEHKGHESLSHDDAIGEPGFDPLGADTSGILLGRNEAPCFGRVNRPAAGHEESLRIGRTQLADRSATREVTGKPTDGRVRQDVSASFEYVTARSLARRV